MPEFEDEPLSAEAWKEIFSTAPPYPDLPDNLVRAVAELGIRVREMAQQLEDGINKQDFLTFNMPLSLATGAARRVTDMATELWVEGMDVMSADYLLDDGDPSTP
jgi:hypothetical protein